MSSCVQWNHNFAQIARESGFRLKHPPKGGTLDWRLIGSIDVDWLVKENDLDRLDSVQGHLSCAPLSSLLLHNSVLDGSVVKYFELAQLSIQFLLFCKQFLDQSVTTLRNNFGELRRKNEKLERLLKRRNEELQAAHSKLQQQQQRRLPDRNTECATTLSVCPKCCKDAINSQGMEIEAGQNQQRVICRSARRASIEDVEDDHDHRYEKFKLDHEDNRNTDYGGEQSRDINLINAIKLQLEVKHLRARLSELEIGLAKGPPPPAPLQRCSEQQQAPPRQEKSHRQVAGEEGNGERPEVVCGRAKETPSESERPRRDIGVQIDGSSIVQQPEVERDAGSCSGGGGAPHAESTATSVMAPSNNQGAASTEDRLMALVQNQLSKVLQQHHLIRPPTDGMPGVPEKTEWVNRPGHGELDAEEIAAAAGEVEVAVAPLKQELSLKPTEIISIAAETSLDRHIGQPPRMSDPNEVAGQQGEQQRFVEDMKHVLQAEIRSMEELWQARYSQLERTCLDNLAHRQGRAGPKLPSQGAGELTGPEDEMTDEGLQEDLGPLGMCRQCPPAESKEACTGVSDADKEIDKNELLMPQVGGINTENWQASAVAARPGVGRHPLTSHRFSPTSSPPPLSKRVQLRSWPAHKTPPGLVARPTSSPEIHSDSPPPSSPPANDSESCGSGEEDGEGVLVGNNLLSVGVVSGYNASRSIDSESSGNDSSGSEDGSDSGDGGDGSKVEVAARRKQVCDQLSERLLAMGVPAGRSGITGDALRRATCHLDEARHEGKGRWRKFFVIRNRVVAQVNGLVAARLNRDEKIIQEVLRREVKQPEGTRHERITRYSEGAKVKAPEQQSFIARERDSRHLQDEKQQQQVTARKIPVTLVGTPKEMTRRRLNLITLNNPVPDANESDDCSATDEEQEAGPARGCDPVKEPKAVSGDNPFRGCPLPVPSVRAVTVVPKPLPRKVLFNLRENNHKFGSSESFESQTEVRTGRGD